MKTHRLYASEFELLFDMGSYLAKARPPRIPHEYGGNASDVMKDIADGATIAGIGAPDRPRPLARRYMGLFTPPMPGLTAGVTLASLNYFPPRGAGQGWHTDTHKPSWRVYMGRSDGAPGRFITRTETIVDEPGMGVMFHVTGNPEDSWHAVWAPSERYSVGVLLTPELAAQMLGQLGA